MQTRINGSFFSRNPKLQHAARLYTLHFTPYTRKIALKCDFSCTSANFVVPLHQILEGNIRMKKGKFTYGNSVISYATASESLLATFTPPL